MKVGNLSIAGVVVLFHPKSTVINNIQTYLDDLDLLYVVDNSENELTTYFSNYFEQTNKIKYIKNNENIGLASALNIGVNKAINDNFNWLLTMDQDSFAEKGLIKNLLCCLSVYNHSKVGIISPTHLIKGERKIKSPQLCLEKDMVMTSGNLLNLEITKDVGTFLDKLFIDQVDVEFCLRLFTSGYKIIKSNTAYLHHKLGNISYHNFLLKKYMTTNHSALRKYYWLRNRLLVADMYNEYYPGLKKGHKKFIKKMIKMIILFESNKIKKLKMLYKGYKDYKRGKYGKYCN